MRLLWVLVPLTLALAGCGDGGGSPPPEMEPTPTTPPPTPPQGIAPMPDEVNITISAVGAYPVNPAFDPEDVVVPAGALVHATFRNRDTLPGMNHNWVVDGIEGAASATIASGADVTFSFTAPLEAGEHVAYCNIQGHREAGMEGTLSVVVS